MDARLGPEERAAALDRMATETFDVVVVGGGVTGVGCALDAATRGLSVALVEQRDLASGTSSRSSKLIHGGLRYLEQLNFFLVAEALRERGLIQSKLCPHLVEPVSFVLPLTHPVWERAYIGSGIMLYDLMAGFARGDVPRHRHLSRRGALRLVPALKSEGLVGAIRYWDAQVDDARHTMTIARTAAAYGAAVATSVRVTDVLRQGDRVTGVVADDLEGGRRLEIAARQVVNATGVWTDEVQDLAGRGRIQVRASKGIHLVVPRDRIHSDSGLITRTPTSVLFVIPWGRHWIIGTTDTDWELDLAHPAASRSDIEYLLGQVNQWLRSPLTHDDIEGVYAGLRPLLHGESEHSSELSREHAVSQSVPGLITVAGGKYTTYRVMAEDTIDVVARGLDAVVPASCTDDVPLVGAEGYEAYWNRRHQLARDSGVHVARIERMLKRYGSRIDEVLDLVADDADLNHPVTGAEDHLRAEIVYAASHEGALHLDDVLTRRTRTSIETWDRGVAAAPEVADLMARVLGWDDDTTKLEVEHYVARVEAERESQQATDDRTADAARMGAPDVRTGTRA